MTKNIYQQDFTQTPKLFELIRKGDNAAAKRHLFWHRRDVHLKGWMDDTPLHIAVNADNVEMVRYLVEHGADVNAARSGTWRFPLNWAKSLEVATYLLERGAEVNAESLEYATRSDLPEIISLLLDRGAKVEGAVPQYLHCTSIPAMQAYLDHGISLDGHDECGRNLLHHCVWANLPAEFDFAYSHGVPWKQACGQNPYYFGKSGGRKEMMTHIRLHYPARVAPTVCAVPTHEVKFSWVKEVMPSRDEAHVIFVWTADERLGRLEIHDGRWSVTRAVHVNVCEVGSMALGPDGRLVLPTADGGLLCLDPVTLELERSVSLQEDLDVGEIVYLPTRGLFLGIAGNDQVVVLDLDFQCVATHDPVDYAIKLSVNPSERLVSIWSSDLETFFVLYQLDLEGKWSHLKTFYPVDKDRSLDLAFSGTGFAVCYVHDLVIYRWASDKIAQVGELSLAQYPMPVDCSAAIFLNESQLIVGRGKQLLLVDVQVPKIIGVAKLEMAKHVVDLYLDGSKEFLIVRGDGLRLLRLDDIHWEKTSPTPN